MGLANTPKLSRRSFSFLRTPTVRGRRAKGAPKVGWRWAEHSPNLGRTGQGRGRGGAGPGRAGLGWAGSAPPPTGPKGSRFVGSGSAVAQRRARRRHRPTRSSHLLLPPLLVLHARAGDGGTSAADGRATPPPAGGAGRRGRRCAPVPAARAIMWLAACF
eukprot:gene11291-biopygen15404